MQLKLMVTFLWLHGYMVSRAGREGAKIVPERRVNPLRVLQCGRVCVSVETELALQTRHRAVEQAAQVVAVSKEQVCRQHRLGQRLNQ